MIEFKDVSFTYPVGVKALRGVSFKVKSGEHVGIIGQNGSGKTTLVKLCNGLLKPSIGEVLVKGLATRDRSIADLSRSVGYVFQNPDDQIFSSSIKKEVLFGPKNLGVSKSYSDKLVKKALQSVGLWNRRNDHPYDVSYNRRKLITIASVLAMNTDVLILDEPTTGQDPVGREVVKGVIESLGRDKTFFVISHDIEFIAETCDRVLVMDDSRLVLDDSARKIFSKKSLLSKYGLQQPMITRVAQRVKGIPNDSLVVSDVLGVLK